MASQVPQMCYMCDAPATTREHVPPKCFFPDGSAVDLITVPSCEHHNNAKQKDDEYLRAILVMNIFTNEAGRHHGRDRVKRAHERKPAMLASLLTTAKPATVIDSLSGSTATTLAISVDQKRISSVLEHFGRAIYFHHFGLQAPKDAEVLPAFLMKSNPSYELPLALLRQAATTSFNAVPPTGANPEVFAYRVREDRASVAVQLCFYGQNIAVVAFRRPAISPP